MWCCGPSPKHESIMDQVKLPPESGEIGDFDLPGLGPIGSIALDLDEDSNRETKSEGNAKAKGKGKKKGLPASRNSLDLTRMKLGPLHNLVEHIPEDLRASSIGEPISYASLIRLCAETAVQSGTVDRLQNPYVTIGSAGRRNDNDDEDDISETTTEDTSSRSRERQSKQNGKGKAEKDAVRPLPAKNSSKASAKPPPARPKPPPPARPKPPPPAKSFAPPAPKSTHDIIAAARASQSAQMAEAKGAKATVPEASEVPAKASAEAKPARMKFSDLQNNGSPRAKSGGRSESKPTGPPVRKPKPTEPSPEPTPALPPAPARGILKSSPQYTPSQTGPRIQWNEAAQVKEIDHYKNIPVLIHRSLWYTPDEWSTMENRNLEEMEDEGWFDETRVDTFPPGLWENDGVPQ